jgi:hypothetical protein
MKFDKKSNSSLKTRVVEPKTASLTTELEKSRNHNYVEDFDRIA